MTSALPRRVGATLLIASLLGGCGLNVAETPPPSGPLPTALPSLPPSVEGTRTALDAALRAGAHVGLEDAPEAYRPAEPPAFVYVPRAVRLDMRRPAQAAERVEHALALRERRRLREAGEAHLFQLDHQPLAMAIGNLRVRCSRVQLGQDVAGIEGQLISRV